MPGPVVVGSQIPINAIRPHRSYRYFTRMDCYGTFAYVATIGGDLLQLHVQRALAPELFAVQEV